MKIIKLSLKKPVILEIVALVQNINKKDFAKKSI
jgi:hypothetical protein